MTKDLNLSQTVLSRALAGKSAHVETATIFDGLDWKVAGARPAGVPHSLFQLLNHMIYWQEWVVRWLDGKKPRPPKHADGGWPGSVSPATRKEWEQTIRRFHRTLRILDLDSRGEDLLSKRGKMTRLEMLHIIGSHNSYHAGQVAFLRQLLAVWPPPSGGVTW
jgi:uncharacterized damage-inducible protein DinB